MTKSVVVENSLVWKESIWLWLTLVIVAALIVTLFYQGLELMVSEWERPEYSHGYLIPVIAAFLIWQRKDRLESMPFPGSFVGLGVVIAGVLIYFIGELSTLYIIIQYGFIVVVMGVAYSLMGWRAFKIILVPLIILGFMVPLPGFFYNNLSSQLQLLSSSIGVAVIRLFDISVYLEGNVIDLGTFKLQVVEACSGLRYLFPLMTLGFIAAYFYRAAFWKRAVIFLSSIPITVLMNSFRIGAIGIMVDRWGQSMAEGFLHDFEGWVIFMACTATLMLEMWALSRFSRTRRPLREVFGMDMPAPTPAGVTIHCRKVPAQLVAAGIVVAVGVLASTQVSTRQEIIPQRTDFAQFPMDLDGWQGRRDQIEQIYVDTLKFDDYIMADYVNKQGSQVNLYVAYYGSQSKGESAHSPRSCLPGGGWVVKSLTQKPLAGIEVSGLPLRINRALITKGDSTQLVYYWFQQRGRIITNEYLVKWYLFWDALTRQRTDGALVRLVVFLGPGEDVMLGDQRLTDFARVAVDRLQPYVPD